MILDYALKATAPDGEVMWSRWSAGMSFAEQKAAILSMATTMSGAAWDPPQRIRMWNVTGIDWPADAPKAKGPGKLHKRLYAGDITAGVSAPFQHLADVWLDWFNAPRGTETEQNKVDILYKKLDDAAQAVIDAISDAVAKYEGILPASP